MNQQRDGSSRVEAAQCAFCGMALDRSRPEASANQPLWQMRERLQALRATLTRLDESSAKLADFEREVICALCSAYLQDVDEDASASLRGALEEEAGQLDQRITMVESERGGPLQDL